MSKSSELSLEQQFSIRSFEHQVKDMNHAQTQEFLVNLYTQMMMQENSYKVAPDRLQIFLVNPNPDRPQPKPAQTNPHS